MGPGGRRLTTFSIPWYATAMVHCPPCGISGHEFVADMKPIPAIAAPV